MGLGTANGDGIMVQGLGTAAGTGVWDGEWGQGRWNRGWNRVWGQGAGIGAGDREWGQGSWDKGWGQGRGTGNGDGTGLGMGTKVRGQGQGAGTVGRKWGQGQGTGMVTIMETGTGSWGQGPPHRWGPAAVGPRAAPALPVLRPVQPGPAGLGRVAAAQCWVPGPPAGPCPLPVSPVSPPLHLHSVMSTARAAPSTRTTPVATARIVPDAQWDDAGGDMGAVGRSPGTP